VWKARFTPDQAGEWGYASASSDALLNGQTGSFSATEPQGCLAYQPGDLPDFSCLGRLAYTGKRYLQFSDGTAWLKGGVDEPEDFLASANSSGFQNHEAAIDYLAAHGVNSIYLLLHNIDGDQRNVWPWVGSDQTEAKTNRERFDLAKLARWEQLFTYIQGKGIVLHLVFEDDSSWIGFDRSLYYREMIARFGHHNGLIWNISEEYDENYTPDQVLEFAGMIRDLDPYDHPITVHHSRSLSFWEPFLGAPQLDLTSFQTDPTPQYAAAAEWVSRVEDSGRTIPISFDETGQLQISQRDLARQIVWSVYLGGANYEIFTQLEAGYKDFEGHFDDMHRARRFLEGLSFTQMSPMPGLLPDGNGYALADPAEVYAFYLFGGGRQTRVDLSGESGSLEFSWFDPRTGETRPGGTVQGGALRSFTVPSSQDWILLLGGACFRSTASSTANFAGRAVSWEGKLPLAGRIYFPLVIHC
jgi:hypothetical protein